MNYIIDGHNLIAQLSGFSLSMPDDEQRLIELLAGFCRNGKHRVEVYFDGAPTGQAGMQNFGRVRAHFVHHRGTADESIRKKLKGLAGSAKNWIVISSDRSIQAAGREAHATVLGSEEFTHLLHASMHTENSEDRPDDEPLSEAEVQEWLEIFKRPPRSRDA